MNPGRLGPKDCDRGLLGVVEASEGETAIQLKWLSPRMKEAAPQALVVSD